MLSGIAMKAASKGMDHAAKRKNLDPKKMAMAKGMMTKGASMAVNTAKKNPQMAVMGASMAMNAASKVATKNPKLASMGTSMAMSAAKKNPKLAAMGVAAAMHSATKSRHAGKRTRKSRKHHKKGAKSKKSKKSKKTKKAKSSRRSRKTRRRQKGGFVGWLFGKKEDKTPPPLSPEDRAMADKLFEQNKRAQSGVEAPQIDPQSQATYEEMQAQHERDLESAGM